MVLYYDEVWHWLDENGESEVGASIHTKYDDDVEPTIYVFNNLREYYNIILKCAYPVKKLSSNLKRLEIIDDHNTHFKDFNFKEIFNSLPETLISLVIVAEKFNEPIDKLPSQLKKLQIVGKSFNHPVNDLPPNLKVFHLSTNIYDHEFNFLPQSLLYFKLNVLTRNFTELINLPNSLEVIYIGMNCIYGYRTMHDKINKKLSIIIPENAKLYVEKQIKSEINIINNDIKQIESNDIPHSVCEKYRDM